MNVKFISSIAVASIVVASGVSAQSSTISTGSANINAPKTSLSVTPGIASGVKSVLKGNMADSQKNNNTVGPFLTPSVTIDYKNSTFDFNLAYELEMNTSKAFGKGATQKGFTKNSYFEHHPVSQAAFKFNSDWALKNMTEVTIDMFTDEAPKSKSEMGITSITQIENKVNSTFTILAGHRLDYTSQYDETVATPDRLSSVPKNQWSATDRASNPNAGQNPSDILNSGILQAKVKFNDSVNLSSYLMAGQGTEYAETNSKYYFYRTNNDLNISAIKDLDLALRARVSYYNPKGNDDGLIQPLGRVIANYALAKNWSLDITNTFKWNDVLGSNAKTTYENENYAGVSYKF